MELPGVGLCPGVPTEENVERCVSAAFNFVVRCLFVPVEQIVVVGEEIGCGAAVRLGVQQDIGCLVLLSPFTTVSDLDHRTESSDSDLSAPSMVLFDEDRSPSQWDNTQGIRHIQCPVLFVSTPGNSLFPVVDAQALFVLCPSLRKVSVVLQKNDPECKIAKFFDDHRICLGPAFSELELPEEVLELALEEEKKVSLDPPQPPATMPPRRVQKVEGPS